MIILVLGDLISIRQLCYYAVISLPLFRF